MERPAPVRTTRHGIETSDIDPDAYKVLRRLNQFGYHAYLVGGSVRDLLLGRSPKDFDVATSARPNEVRKLFRNCRLIGRRFRLAHILFSGGKVIETATFRALPQDAHEGDALITDDNEFGSPESDAHRRDFTVNALFYDRSTNEVIDYVGGLEDLEARRIETIGEPVLRFREDPVRMLRAVKFAARLDFEIETRTLAAIREVRLDLSKSAVPRLHGEILRMLYGGAAAKSIELMADLGMLDLLLPEVAAFLGRPSDEPWEPMRGLLAALDPKCAGQPAVSNGVLLATLFWPLYQALIDELPHTPHVRHLRPLAENLIGSAAVRLRMPRRDVNTLLAVLVGQMRFDQSRRKKSNRASLARNPYFPAMLDFLELRAQAEPIDEEDLEAWRALADEHQEQEPGRGRRRGRRRRRR